MKTEKSLTLNAYCFIFSVNIEWTASNKTNAKKEDPTCHVATKPVHNC